MVRVEVIECLSHTPAADAAEADDKVSAGGALGPASGRHSASSGSSGSSSSNSSADSVSLEPTSLVSLHAESPPPQPSRKLGVSMSASSLLLSSSSSSLIEDGENGQQAPPTRRRGLSKLRRRLSQTFRMSFHGSLSELASHASAFTIHEEREDQTVDGGVAGAYVGVGSNGDTTERRGNGARNFRHFNSSGREYNGVNESAPARRGKITVLMF